MFRFLALAATAALVSAQTCPEKANDLHACITAIPAPDFETDSGRAAYESAISSCCPASLSYTATCDNEYGYIDLWRSWKDSMPDHQWNTAIYMLSKCPREAVTHCVQKLEEVAYCAKTTPDAADCCGAAENAGRCEGYDLGMLWDQVSPTANLDRTSLEGPVAEIFRQCPTYSPSNCEQVAEELSSLVEPLSDDAVYQNDMSKRCTAGAAVSYICKGQDELLDLISGSFSDAKKNHFYKQIEACKVGDEDGDGPHCGEIIPNVYLYHEAAITYLAMGYCPTTADPTSSPGVLCDPVHNPVTGQFMFYKVGYFNSDTMMETPPDCMPAPVDAMP